MVRAPAKVIVPDGALKVPPLIVKAPFKSAPFGKVKVPELKVNVVDTTNEV